MLIGNAIPLSRCIASYLSSDVHFVDLLSGALGMLALLTCLWLVLDDVVRYSAISTLGSLTTLFILYRRSVGDTRFFEGDALRQTTAEDS